jgi:hypothetical protein
MSKPWRELLSITAHYYKAGEFPYSIDQCEIDTDLWWYPNIPEDASKVALPRDDEGNFTTDAVHFISTFATATGVSDSHVGGALAYAIDQDGAFEILFPYVNELKMLCDHVRGVSGERAVEALIVFECDAGKDPNTADGPGEYWREHYPIGLLDLGTAPLICELEPQQ